MKNSNERFAIINTIAHEVIWDWDLVKDTMWWNDHYYNFYGYPRDGAALEPGSWKNNMLPEDSAAVMQLIGEVIRKKQKSWSAEYRFLKANFTILNIYSRGTVFYDENGKALRIVGTMIDVSEQKKTEQDLKKRNDELHELSVFLQQEREKENTSFAYEMHEQIGQELAGAQVQLSSVMDQLSSGNAALLKQLLGIDQILRNCIEKVGRISSSLYPSILNDLGLIEALQWVNEKFSATNGVQVIFSSEEEEFPIAAESRIALYRTYQQAIENAVQHGSTEIICTLRNEKDQLLLTICDNGKNFMEAEGIRNSVPFLAMKERISDIGGSLHGDTDWKEGTNLEIRLPLTSD